MLRQSLTISIVFLIIIMSQNNFTLSELFHPKDMYLTPDLWEFTGISFWFAFLFETPFVLLREYALPLLISFHIFLSYKIQHDYNKSLKNIDTKEIIKY